jgi:hypothetical protein
VVDVPFFEYFETDLPTGPLWTVLNPEYDMTWDTLRCTGLPWTQLSAFVDHRNYSPRADQYDGLVSPAINIPTADSAALRFSYSYAFRHQSFADTLIVDVSTDCGLTWGTALFRKGGEELAVFDTSGYFVPDASADWREVWLDMSAYMGSTVLIRFGTINRNGNTLALDDINVYTGQQPAAVAHDQAPMATVYPNPVGRNMPWTVEIPAEMGQTPVLLTDASGRIIERGMLNPGRHSLGQNLPAGLYLLQVGNGAYRLARD